MKNLLKTMFIALCLCSFLVLSGCSTLLDETDNLHLVTVSPEKAEEMAKIAGTEDLCDGPALFAGAKRKSGKLVVKVRCESDVESGDQQ